MAEITKNTITTTKTLHTNIRKLTKIAGEATEPSVAAGYAQAACYLSQAAQNLAGSARLVDEIAGSDQGPSD